MFFQKEQNTTDQRQETTTMRCAECGDEIKGKPVKQDGEMYCSLECAYLASGFDPDDEDDYYEEDPVEGSIEEDEE